MKAFAALLDGLVYTPSRNGKLRLLADYFRGTPDPDRGWALAALTDGLSQRHAKPALVRGLTEARVDPVLFRLSYDYVGDLAETVSLIWPDDGTAAETPLRLGDVVAALQTAGPVRGAGIARRLARFARCRRALRPVEADHGRGCVLASRRGSQRPR